MTIYYDVSESRTGTRLHPRIVQDGFPVAGLEDATGADILITPMGEGLSGNVNHPPGSIQLKMYMKNSWLVQRKSDGDMLGSIPKLRNILTRMRTVADPVNATCWLLVDGVFEPTGDGMVILNDYVTNWNWHSLHGVLEMWQILGGKLCMQPNSLASANIILRWNQNIKKWAEEVITLMETPQDIHVPQFDPRPWRKTLMTFPGVGDISSDRIAEHCGNLAESMVWLTDLTSFGVKGIGPKIRNDARKYLGLKDEEYLQVLTNMPTISFESETK